MKCLKFVLKQKINQLNLLHHTNEGLKATHMNTCKGASTSAFKVVICVLFNGYWQLENFHNE